MALIQIALQVGKSDKGNFESFHNFTMLIDEQEIALAARSKEKWEHGTKKTVRFLTEHEPVEVHLVSSQDPALETILAEIVDGNPMALDLEWSSFDKLQMINCYQICSTRGVVVIHDINTDPNEIIRNFLHAESGNEFIAKGCGCDYAMLHNRFGDTFRIYMEDVHITRLAPNNLPVNFEMMVEMLAGPSTAQFKNKKVSRSNWSATELSVQEVLYAAFDAFSLYQCVQKLPEPSGDPYSCSIPKKLRGVMGIADSPEQKTQPVSDHKQEAEPSSTHPKHNRNKKTMTCCDCEPAMTECKDDNAGSRDVLRRTTDGLTGRLVMSNREYQGLSDSELTDDHTSGCADDRDEEHESELGPREGTCCDCEPTMTECKDDNAGSRDVLRRTTDGLTGRLVMSNREYQGLSDSELTDDHTSGTVHEQASNRNPSAYCSLRDWLLDQLSEL